MTIITDPLFYAFAIPAVILLGLSKGGFAGIGTATTPLLALYMQPLEVAALILPLLMTQDAISIWWYRREPDQWAPRSAISCHSPPETAAWVSEPSLRQRLAGRAAIGFK